MLRHHSHTQRSSHSCNRFVAAGAKRGLRQWRSKKTGNRRKESPLSEAELLAELNARNDWALGDGGFGIGGAAGDIDDAFGLEDVAEYARAEAGGGGAGPGAARGAGRRGGSAARRDKDGGGGGGDGAAALERELAAAAAASAAGREADVPAWVRELTAEGFSVAAGRGGELFLQRGSGSSGGSGGAGLWARALAPDPFEIEEQPQRQQQQHNIEQQQEKQSRELAARRAAIAAAAAADPAAFLVGEEFQPNRWSAVLEANSNSSNGSRNGTKSTAAAAAAAAAVPRAPSAVAAADTQPGLTGPAQETFEEDDGELDGADSASGSSGSSSNGAGPASRPAGADAAWWLGDEAGSAAAAVLGAAAAADAKGTGVPRAPSQPPLRPPRAPVAATAAAAAPDLAPRLERLLADAPTPEAALRLAEAAYPEWAANNCRLLDQSRGAPVAAPTPAEAAAVLRGAALAARRRRLKPVQTMSLARDHRVRGLAECLRVAPPRFDDGPLPPPAAAAAWAAAKAYWRPPDTAAAAAAAAAVAGSSSSSTDGTAAASAANGTPAPALQQQLTSLVERVRAGGATLTRAQVAAARALLALRAADARRRRAFVSALWALSALGGPWLFEAEVDALLRVAAPALAAWPLTGREAADALWALANARHWTPALPAFEAAVLRAGGAPALRPPQVAAVLWAFATLAYRPDALLKDLAASWANGSGGNGTGKGGGGGGATSLRALQPGQLAAVVWSLAVVGAVRTPAFELVWAEALRRGLDGASWRRHHLVQIAQAALAVRLEGGGSDSGNGSSGSDSSSSDSGSSPGAGAALLAAARAAFAAEAAALRGAGGPQSAYQHAVAAALGGLRVVHVLEDTVEGYSIDVSIPSLRVAIEADGPSHVSRNKAARGGGKAATAARMKAVPLGATRMKARHLTALGWRVVNVDWGEWEALGSAPARAAFLRARIDAAVKQPLPS